MRYAGFSKYFVGFVILFFLVACDFSVNLFSTPTPVPTPLPTSTETPVPTSTPTPTPTITPTPTLPYSVEERTELIALCEELWVFYDELDTLLDEWDAWEDSGDWDELYNTAIYFSDWYGDIVVLVGGLPRPRPAREFNDQLGRSMMNYHRATTMLADFYYYYGDRVETYDSYLELDQQAWDEYNAALDAWEDLAEEFEFDPWSCW